MLSNRKIVAIATIAVSTALAAVSVAGVATAQDAQPVVAGIPEDLPAADRRADWTPQLVAAANTANQKKAAYDNTPVQQVAAQRGDGLIRLTKRTCGSAHGWWVVAAANNVSGPVFRIGEGQVLTVDCVAAAAATGRAPEAITPARAAAPATAPAAAAPAPAPASVSGNWTKPIANGCAGSRFGWRGGRIHNGVDIPTSVGTLVRAAGSGTVHWGNDPVGAGWYITIDHGSGLWTTYYHLSERWAQPGQWVNVGDNIAKSGGAKGAPGAGNSSGPHLHFEVHPWGEWTKHWSDSLGANAYTDPVAWMSRQGVSLTC